MTDEQRRDPDHADAEHSNAAAAQGGPADERTDDMVAIAHAREDSQTGSPALRADAIAPTHDTELADEAASPRELRSGPAGAYDHLAAEVSIAKDALPTPDDLRGAELALHGIQEFVTAPMLEAFKEVAREGRSGSVSYEQIGRVLVWVDTIRAACSYILYDVATIAVIAREMASLAENCIMDTSFEEPEFMARQRRAHGLDGSRIATL
jgi:hypothetical protein